MNELMSFIASIDNETRKLDAITLLSILEKNSGYKPFLSGSIIGFGQYHYKYESGREGDSPVIAFSPRKHNLVVYIMPGFSQYEELLKSLGKYKLGKSCLYINKLSEIKLDVFEKITALSVKHMQQNYPCKMR